MKPKIIRITTVPISLKILLKGQLQFMKYHFDVLAVSSSPQQTLDEVGKQEGVATEILDMTRSISPLSDLHSLWKFYKLCKKEKPMIVHSHTPKAGIVGMLGAKLAGVPIRLHTVAGLPLMEAIGFKRIILNWVEKLTYYAASKVYPNSNGLYDFILEQKFTTADKLMLLANGSSNGIDTSFFSPNTISIEQKGLLKNKMKVIEKDFIFIFVGRLVKDKGINELMVAFQNLAVTFKNVKLLLVGNFEQDLDPLYPETLEIINSHKQVIAVGFQTDVRPFFAIANVLVFPSYREGFPNVVLQAGAMGLPSIVTNINGCNEIITDKENGLIIPPKKAEELEQAMNYCLSNNEFYEKAAENARGRIEKNFRQQIVWDAILAEYKTRLDQL